MEPTMLRSGSRVDRNASSRIQIRANDCESSTRPTPVGTTTRSLPRTRIELG
jgi:hypothetical protein